MVSVILYFMDGQAFDSPKDIKQNTRPCYRWVVHGVRPGAVLVKPFMKEHPVLHVPFISYCVSFNSKLHSPCVSGICKIELQFCLI